MDVKDAMALFVPNSPILHKKWFRFESPKLLLVSRARFSVLKTDLPIEWQLWLLLKVVYKECGKENEAVYLK